VVQTRGNVARFHVLAADDEHGVDAGLPSIGDLGFDWIWAEVAMDAQLFEA
jgi:hypothetical protein